MKLKWLLKNVTAIREAVAAGECMAGTVDSWLIWVQILYIVSDHCLHGPCIKCSHIATYVAKAIMQTTYSFSKFHPNHLIYFVSILYWLAAMDIILDRALTSTSLLYQYSQMV